MTNKRFTGGILLALMITFSAAFSACNKAADSPDAPSYGISAPESDGSMTESESFSSESSSGESGSAESSSNESSLSESSAEATPQIRYTQYIRCTAENVRIRTGAGTSSTILGIAEKGTVYALIDKVNGWYKIYYRNQVAYISASYTVAFSLENHAREEVESVLLEAAKLLGVPYVYGAVRLHDGEGRLLNGFTAQKFDCSSLVQYAFYKGANVLLQVTTRTQFLQGRKVAKADLQRGDCLYFTNEERRYNVGTERVGHVAVYLGENYILHTASDYARIEQISAARWNFFIEGRRFL